jgi:hypothetical protein
VLRSLRSPLVEPPAQVDQPRRTSSKQATIGQECLKQLKTMLYRRTPSPPSESISVAEGTCVVGELGGYRVIKAGTASTEHVRTRCFTAANAHGRVICCLLTGRQIGQGHFARVYLAEEVETGNQYALKVVNAIEPSFDAELAILWTIAAEVRPCMTGRANGDHRSSFPGRALSLSRLLLFVSLHREAVNT